MSFALDLKKFAEKAEANAEQVVRSVTLNVASKVVMSSPVGNPDYWLSLQPYTDLKTKKIVTQREAPAGYVGGRFRANWQFSEGGPASGEIDAVDPDGTKTIARLQEQILRSKVGGVTYVANNLPYALRLEYGWSKQAPSGMVRTTLAEFDSYVRKAVGELDK